MYKNQNLSPQTSTFHMLLMTRGSGLCHTCVSQCCCCHIVWSRSACNNVLDSVNAPPTRKLYSHKDKDVSLSVAILVFLVIELFG